MKKMAIPAVFVLLLAIAAVIFAPPLAGVREEVSAVVTPWADKLVRKPGDPGYMSAHYLLRKFYFAIDPAPAHPVVFLGDSITYGGDWDKLFPQSPVENRGIGGDSTRGLLARLDQVIALKPSQIFLMIGTNDLCYNRPIPAIIDNYRLILARFRHELPDTQVYVESVLPFNDRLFPSRALRSNANIATLNVGIRQVAREFDYPYVDLAPAFTGANGRLPAADTTDGLHLSEKAYYVWRDRIKPLVAVSNGNVFAKTATTGRK